jgi:hypothetical protein
MDIMVGDVFESLSTGDRWRVVKLHLPSHQDGPKGRGKVEVSRLNPPKWDDGKYIWAAESFQEGTMRNLACGCYTDKAAIEATKNMPRRH